MEVNEQTTAAPAGNEAQTAAPQGQEQAAPQTTDIDGLSEFTFQGEKYTPEKWHKIYSEYQTYSQQAKEWNEEKKFIDNLEVDLANVLERPELAQQFKAVYPQKYHAILDRALGKAGQTQPQTNNAQTSLPKEFLTDFQAMKQRLAFHEQRAYEAEVQAANAKLDAILPDLFKKFELANEEQVYARAENMLQAGQKLTDKTWERLVRESHEAQQKRADRHYQAKLKEQTEKGQRAQDTGAGGASPGQAPKKARTFSEAQDQMIAWAKQQKMG